MRQSSGNDSVCSPRDFPERGSCTTSMGRLYWPGQAALRNPDSWWLWPQWLKIDRRELHSQVISFSLQRALRSLSWPKMREQLTRRAWHPAPLSGWHRIEKSASLHTCIQYWSLTPPPPPDTVWMTGESQTEGQRGCFWSRKTVLELLQGTLLCNPTKSISWSITNIYAKGFF